MKSIKPTYIVVAALLVFVAVVFVPQAMSDKPGQRSVSDGMVTQTIGVGGTDSVATYQVNLLEGSDAEHEATHMFEALAGLPGVGDASLDTAALTLTVAYDSELMHESFIRERLVGAGYVVPGAADATPTEVAEDGSSQRISVGDDGVAFDPYLISAEASIPVTIDFAPGKDCRVIVRFPELGIEQDISQGGTVVLPALEPGQYTIACGGDGPEGVLFVE